MFQLSDGIVLRPKRSTCTIRFRMRLGLGEFHDEKVEQSLYLNVTFLVIDMIYDDTCGSIVIGEIE